MIYLIEQLWFWLVLTAVFAALAGWAFAAERAAPAQAAQKRDRENLVRDLAKLAAGEEVIDFNGEERENDAIRRLIELRDGRIAELESALEAARERADEAASRVAELERAPAPSAEEGEEVLQLRALVAQYEEERGREVVVQAAPAAAEEDDQAQALQAWRLRYFEQRVRYLESQAHAAPAVESALASEAAEPETADAPLVDDWRAREAEARAAYLENELRALMTAHAEAEAAALAQAEAEAELEADEPALASNADIDMLLRWRLLYLERRVAHLQSKAAEAEPAPAEGPDPELWKWRTRYLEARVRHLEQRQPAAPPAAVAEQAPEAEAAPAPAPVRPLKPPVLAAPRNGAPDDFTLIEDVTALQQNTLYSIGVFHFDQIAAWTPSNIAWVDDYLHLRGRIVEEEWVEQAQDLARGGVAASRRMLESEDA